MNIFFYPLYNIFERKTKPSIFERKTKPISIFAITYLYNYYTTFCAYLIMIGTIVITWSKFELDCSIFLSGFTMQAWPLHNVNERRTKSSYLISLEMVYMINGTRYSALLAKKLEPAIHNKCWSLLSKKVLLSHDDAHPHTAAQTIEIINQLGFEVLENPANNSDLAHCNYYIFWTAQIWFIRSSISYRWICEGTGA